MVHYPHTVAFKENRIFSYLNQPLEAWKTAKRLEPGDPSRTSKYSIAMNIKALFTILFFILISGIGLNQARSEDPKGAACEKPKPKRPAPPPRVPWVPPNGDGTHIFDTDPADDFADEMTDFEKQKQFLEFDMRMQSIQSQLDEIENPTQDQIRDIIRNSAPGFDETPSWPSGWRGVAGFGARRAAGQLIDGLDEAMEAKDAVAAMGGAGVAARLAAGCVADAAAAAAPVAAGVGAFGAGAGVGRGADYVTGNRLSAGLATTGLGVGTGIAAVGETLASPFKAGYNWLTGSSVPYYPITSSAAGSTVQAAEMTASGGGGFWGW